MEVKAQQLKLYIPLLITSVSLLIIGLGPGLFNQTTLTGYSWQHKVFNLLCHQDPYRSFAINGEPMAICARCLGIYGSFAFVVLLMQLIGRFLTVINRLVVKLIMITIVLNLVDVFFNGIGIWTNTLHSRFLLGAFFGGSLALILTNEFFKQIGNSEESYGT
tara:strand:- start:2805 stop:3290 length:486 start_codon:yes stop_codon:yes gene_type:complete